MSRKRLQTMIEIQDRYSKELKGFSDDLKKATEEMEKMNLKGTSGTAKLSTSLINLSTVVKGVGVTYLSKKIFDLGNFAVGASSKMKELENVTNQVFNTSKKEIEDWAKSIDNKIGRSIYQMQNFASVYGSMFKGAGFQDSFFKDISKELAVLTADFSSFYNVRDDEVFTALKGALTGETEALKRYGIILNDTVMSQYALTKGIKGSWTELDAGIKMQLRYNKLMEMTSFIQGDAARTIDGYANSLKKAEGLIDNIATSIGHKLIPSATGAIHMFNDIAESIEMMLNKKDTSEYLFDFVEEKNSITELKDRYVELSELYLKGLNTPESERERIELYEKLNAIYPSLIGQISKEADGYIAVAKALDGVIANLKTKALQEAQQDIWKDALTNVKKYQRQLNEIDAEQTNKAHDIDMRYHTNVSTLYSKEDLKKISSLMMSSEHDTTSDKELNGLIRDIASKNNVKADKTLIKATKEYAENAGLLAVKADIAINNIEGVFEEARKESEAMEKTLPQLLNVIENQSYENKAYQASKSSEEIVKKVENKNSEIEKERAKDSTKLTEENNKKLATIKENYKKGVYKTVDDYKKVLSDLTAIGTDPIFRAEIDAKIKAMQKSKGKSKSQSSAPKEVKWNDYQYDMKLSERYQNAIGAKDENKLKARISIIQSYMRKAIEQGRSDLVEGLKHDLETTQFSIKRLKVNEALDGVQKDLNSLDSKFKKGTISKENYHKKSYKVLDEVIGIYEEHGWKLSEIDRKEIENKIKELKDKKGIHGKEIEEYKEFLNKLKKINSVVDGLNSLSASFSQLGAITGSKTASGIGNIFGSIAGMSNAYKDFSMKSIKGMFGGTEAFGKGLTSIGSIGSMVTAGLGIVSTIGSLTGGAKGKRQKARIEKENQRQLKLYEENSKHLIRLTEVIRNNSKKLESFSDKLSDSISKNPTLNRITKGKGSLNDLKDMLVQNKVFGDISAVQKGHTYYKKSWGRVGKKNTYVNRMLKDKALLEYLGFNGDSKQISEQNFKNLLETVKNVTTSDINKVYNNHDKITKSNVDTWVKNVQEWGYTISQLANADSGLFKGTTMGSFAGMDYKSNLQLIKEYKDMLKGMGIDADKEQYKSAIESMIEGNNLLVTSMQEVRGTFVDGFASGKDGAFLNGMKSYFGNVFKNVSSVVYDVGFSDFDEKFSKSFENISEKLVKIKSSGKLNFNGIFDDFDFKQLESASLFEKQYKKQIDGLKSQLKNSGVDLSIIEQILPTSDWNKKIEEMRNAIQNALGSGMNVGLTEHKFESFTMTIGQSLYESTKGALTKAFGESKIYQNMLSKYFDTSSIKAKLEKATSLKEVFSVGENIMKNYGMQLEAAGFGGFGAINNKADMDSHLGNAYYQDKASNVNINVTNHFNAEVYGVDDLETRIRKATEDGISHWNNKPKALA